MKKKRIIATLLAAVVVTATLSACGGGSAGTSAGSTSGGSDAASSSSESTAASGDITPMKLRATSGVNLGHILDVGFYTPLMEDVTEQSGGAITFDYFSSGELITYGQELDALLDGSVDVALSLTPTYDMARFPLSDLVCLPLYGVEFRVTNASIYDLNYSDVKLGDTGKTFYEYEFGDKGLVAFPVIPMYNYYFVSGGKEFNSPADFSQETKVRTGGHCISLLLNNLGCSSVTMPIGEVYDGLSRGTVDAAVACPTWVDFGYADILKYCLGPVLFNFNSWTAMTEDTWNSLPEEVQKMFRESADKHIVDGCDTVESMAKEQLKFIEDNGAKMVDIADLGDEMVDYLNEAIHNTWMDWIDEMSSNGHPAKEVCVVYRDILVENGAELDDWFMNELDNYVPNSR